jgi:hypothetical protein
MTCVAVHLRDLTFLLEGNAKYLDTTANTGTDDTLVINFDRIRMQRAFIYGLGVHNLVATSVPLPSDIKLLRSISKVSRYASHMWREWARLLFGG